VKINRGFCVVEHGPLIIAQLHATKIGVINRVRRTGTLYHGGYKTRSTKEAMNKFLARAMRLIGTGYFFHVYQSKFNWYLSTHNDTKEFSEDGAVSFTF
jgi:hypothetical protein